MSWPSSVTYDSFHERLFVADTDGHIRVLVYDVSAITDGESAQSALGQTYFTWGTGATTQSGMMSPTGVIYDSAHQRLFVSDGPNNRVMVFDVTSVTNGEAAINVLGQPDFTSSRSGGLTRSGLNTPNGLGYDVTRQRLFVADALNHRIMVFDATSVTDGEAAINVLGQPDFLEAIPFPPTQSKTSHPMGVNYDAPSHKLFVADTSNNRILIFDL
jgi:DNA-binding beta-propeller fold protein YncE